MVNNIFLVFFLHVGCYFDLFKIRSLCVDQARLELEDLPASAHPATPVLGLKVFATTCSSINGFGWKLIKANR